MGKRGGIRLIYYYWVPDAIILLTAYPKNKKENLTDADKEAFRKLIESLKRES